MFHKDKKLHLIFGDFHQPAGYHPGIKDVRGAEQEVDWRHYPIKAGGRESGEAHEWQIVSVKDQSFYCSGEEMRADWLASKCGSSASVTLARRLATLGWLKKKNLISREEYNSKRQEVMNDL